MGFTRENSSTLSKEPNIMTKGPFESLEKNSSNPK